MSIIPKKKKLKGIVLCRMLEIMLNKNNAEPKKKILILNNEQKIIYAEKRVNNFLNNAE